MFNNKDTIQMPQKDEPWQKALPSGRRMGSSHVASSLRSGEQLYGLGETCDRRRRSTTGRATL